MHYVGTRRAILGWGTTLAEILASSQFFAPFNDLGAGAVETTLARGTGAATFTRDTVAWTRLSSGLWAEIGSGTARSFYHEFTAGTFTYGGYVAEGARTARITTNVRDLTANWTGSNVTIAATGTGIDGVENSCSRFTATQNAGTVNRAVTLVSGARVFQPFVKRVTGTGTIEVSVNGGTNWVDITASLSTTSWYQATATATVTNPDVTFRMGTSGDVILVDMAELSDGTFASTPNAGQDRNADVLTYPFAGNASASQGWAYAEASVFWNTAIGAASRLIGVGNSSGVLQHQSAATPTEATISDESALVTKTGLSSMFGAVRKRASRWGGSTMAVTGDGAAVESGAFDGAVGSAAIGIGCSANGGTQLNGTLRNIRIGTGAITDATLQGMTG